MAVKTKTKNQAGVFPEGARVLVTDRRSDGSEYEVAGVVKEDIGSVTVQVEMHRPGYARKRVYRLNRKFVRAWDRAE